MRYMISAADKSGEQDQFKILVKDYTSWLLTQPKRIAHKGESRTYRTKSRIFKK